MTKKHKHPQTIEIEAKSDDELISIRSDLQRQFQIKSSEATNIAKKLSRIKSELKRRRTTNQKPFVSDHAVLRFLERVKGVDVEKI